MTTSDVATISSPANPDEVLNDTPLDNADDFAPGARGDDADFYPGNVGTAVKSGGSGSGNNGGFDIGNHLAFDGEGSTDGARWMVTQPIDTTNLDHIVMSIITGNDSNGGETPDDDLADDILFPCESPIAFPPAYTSGVITISAIALNRFFIFSRNQLRNIRQFFYRLALNNSFWTIT